MLTRRNKEGKKIRKTGNQVIENNKQQGNKLILNLSEWERIYKTDKLLADHKKEGINFQFQL